MSAPWYRQFWPWFLIFFPLSAVVAGFVTLNIAVTGHNDMVVDDYYKQGKAINLQVERYEEAVRRNLSFALTIDSSGEHLALTKRSGDTLENGALRIALYHATHAKYDLELMVTAGADGVYRATLESPLTGNWHVSIDSPIENWKVQTRFALPHAADIIVNPSL